jgi:transposase
MSSPEIEQLIRKRVGELPLLYNFAKKLGFREILSKHIKPHGNEKFPTVDTLMLLVYNLAGGRQPLYELEEWVLKLDSRPLGYRSFETKIFNDDRFGRALDKLYYADRASLTTQIALNTVRATRLNLEQVNNDSTTLKAFGKIPGKTKNGLFLARGHSKDHRPDLKQLVYNLTISADGAVPVHFKTYPGNRTDDTTHIETWNTLCSIAGRANFLYVADCKVCTDTQLSYITSRGGRVVTIMPDTWKESERFKESLRTARKAKSIVWHRPIPNFPERRETFSRFRGNHHTLKRQYPIYWFHSTEKKKRDRLSREQRMQKAEYALTQLIGKLNYRKLKTETQILERVGKILDQYKVEPFYHINLMKVKESYCAQAGKGRPGKHTRYVTRYKMIYSLAWTRKDKVLKNEQRLDGIFPLVCTDINLSAKEALVSYKYQPRLEKRFCQLKKDLVAAPLLFKKIERLEAMMSLLFMALILQAVIEREVRQGMKHSRLEAIPVYPEHRLAYHPTTAIIFDRFQDLSTHFLVRGDIVVKEYRDPLTDLQKEILSLLNIPEQSYWERFLQ